MHVFWASLALSSLAIAQSRVDPRILSIYPFTGQRGSTVEAKVRGNALMGASGVAIGNAPFKITVEGVEPEPAEPSNNNRKAAAVELVKLRIEISPDAKPGRYPIRLITRNGVSNTIPIHVSDYAQNLEPEGPHETGDTAVPVSAVPAAFSGKITRR